MDSIMIEKITVYDNITALAEIYPNLPLINVIAEIIFNFMGFFPLTLSIVLFSKLKIFHFNLTILLNDLMAAYLIRTFLRIIVCSLIMVEILDGEFLEYKNAINIFDFICAVCQFVCGMNLWLIFMERFYATLYAKTYEYQRNNCVLLIGVVFKWLFVLSLLLITAFGHISIIISVILCGLLLFISGIGMIYLHHCNHKLYSQQADATRTLSYCYQLSENVRSFEMLIPMMSLLLVGCLFTMFIYISTMFLTDSHWNAILGAAFNLIVSGGSFFLPLVTMFFHRTLRSRMKRALVKRPKPMKSVSVSPINPPTITIADPRTLTGKKLIIESSEEATNVYFKQISSQWQ